MEGLNDGRAIKTIVPQVNPRRMVRTPSSFFSRFVVNPILITFPVLIFLNGPLDLQVLVHGTSAAADELLETCKAIPTMTSEVYAPDQFESLQIGENMISYPLSLGDSLMPTLKMSKVRLYHNCVWLKDVRETRQLTLTRSRSDPVRRLRDRPDRRTLRLPLQLHHPHPRALLLLHLLHHHRHPSSIVIPLSPIISSAPNPSRLLLHRRSQAHPPQDQAPASRDRSRVCRRWRARLWCARRRLRGRRRRRRRGRGCAEGHAGEDRD
jgi:hypothetical protein